MDEALFEGSAGREEKEDRLSARVACAEDGEGDESWWLRPLPALWGLAEVADGFAGEEEELLPGRLRPSSALIGLELVVDFEGADTLPL